MTLGLYRSDRNGGSGPWPTIQDPDGELEAIIKERICLPSPCQPPRYDEEPVSNVTRIPRMEHWNLETAPEWKLNELWWPTQFQRSSQLVVATATPFDRRNGNSDPTSTSPSLDGGIPFAVADAGPGLSDNTVWVHMGTVNKVHQILSMRVQSVHIITLGRYGEGAWGYPSLAVYHLTDDRFFWNQQLRSADADDYAVKMPADYWEAPPFMKISGATETRVRSAWTGYEETTLDPAVLRGRQVSPGLLYDTLWMATGSIPIVLPYIQPIDGAARPNVGPPFSSYLIFQNWWEPLPYNVPATSFVDTSHASYKGPTPSNFSGSYEPAQNEDEIIARVKVDWRQEGWLYGDMFMSKDSRHETQDQLMDISTSLYFNVESDAESIDDDFEVSQSPEITTAIMDVWLARFQQYVDNIPNYARLPSGRFFWKAYPTEDTYAFLLMDNKYSSDMLHESMTIRAMRDYKSLLDPDSGSTPGLLLRIDGRRYQVGSLPLNIPMTWSPETSTLAELDDGVSAYAEGEIETIDGSPTFLNITYSTSPSLIGSRVKLRMPGWWPTLADGDGVNAQRFPIRSTTWWKADWIPMSTGGC